MYSSAHIAIYGSGSPGADQVSSSFPANETLAVMVAKLLKHGAAMSGSFATIFMISVRHGAVGDNIADDSKGAQIVSNFIDKCRNVAVHPNALVL